MFAVLGDPQGTVHSSLDFLVYKMNDLYLMLSDLFADDCLLSRPIIEHTAADDSFYRMIYLI